MVKKMKKKILIVSHALELGGAERSLIGFLDALDPEQCEVELFLLRHEGELLEMIPEHVRLLPQVPAYTVLARPMKDTFREGHVLLTAARLAGKICAAWYTRGHHYTDSGVALEYSHKFTCPLMPKIQQEVEYDLAISFLTPHYFVAEKVRAKKKIAWIHTDYTTVQVDAASETGMWGRYDHIASISEATGEAFIKTFPTLKEKIMLIENILPERLIRKQAEEPIIWEKNSKISLLSIGRFCTAKNFDHVPNICRLLREKGLDVSWYLIGYGGDEALIRAKIVESKMEDYVIVLGKKENPYPYIKACDVYVQPSRYEGKCVSVREAQMLGKPVVIARYATSGSQLQDGVDGLIVSQEDDTCAEEMALVLRDEKLMKMLARNCSQRQYANREEVEKIYQLLRKDDEN